MFVPMLGAIFRSFVHPVAHLVERPTPAILLPLRARVRDISALDMYNYRAS